MSSVAPCFLISRNRFLLTGYSMLMISRAKEIASHTETWNNWKITINVVRLMMLKKRRNGLFTTWHRCLHQLYSQTVKRSPVLSQKSARNSNYGHSYSHFNKHVTVVFTAFSSMLYLIAQLDTYLLNWESANSRASGEVCSWKLLVIWGQ